ncbi:leucine-rich repeat-containing protein 24-like [Octopus vulgaris]|uniref:Leucine-rich repeat-containing protein 24-like n=1 Tax=Octopus vulgaris TaxID=6645 RepID=A0AA36BRR4_OCTVU|nr:leucine-rich repeat-containing protein 24-like [Octopus vulgaris]
MSCQKLQRSPEECVPWLLTTRSMLILLTGIMLLNTLGLSLENSCQVLGEENQYQANCCKLNLTHVPYNLLKSIRSLYLDHNRIALTKESYYFTVYENLKVLSLVNNSIKFIHAKSFFRLKLEVLELSGNLLRNVPVNALRGQSFLQNLSLENNRIDYITKADFQKLESLIELKLSGNYIKSIDGMSFIDLKNLYNLELHQNSLQTLPHNLFQSCNESLQTITLSQNSWYCDCHLRWLSEYFLIKNWTSASTGMHCKIPLSLQSKKFLSIPWELFACPLVMDSSSTKMIVKNNDNISLICRVQSNPPARISWWFNNKLIDDFEYYTITHSVGINGMSVLQVSNFDFGDMGSYKCVAQNSVSNSSVVYTLVIEGFSQYKKKALTSSEAVEQPSSVHSAVISVCVTGGLISLCIIIVLVFYYWKRFTRLQEQKQEEIKLKIKNHFESSRNYKPDSENNKSPTSEQGRNEETEPLYDAVKPVLQPQRETQLSDIIANNKQAYTDLQEVEAYSPSTLMTTLDSDNTGVFWTGSSRNDCSSNPSDLACPLLETSGYISYPNEWEINGEVFLTPYPSPHPRYVENYPRSVPSLPPYYTHSFHNHHPPYHSNTSSMPMGPCDWPFSTMPYPGKYEDHNRCASVGSVGSEPIPPKKPPRLHSYSSTTSDRRKFSLPKPGSVDEFGTAV